MDLMEMVLAARVRRQAAAFVYQSLRGLGEREYGGDDWADMPKRPKWVSCLHGGMSFTYHTRGGRIEGRGPGTPRRKRKRMAARMRRLALRMRSR